MITNMETRNLQAEKLLQHRNRSATLTNIIAKGTNCSSFEAEIITQKAEEVFHIGSHSPDENLQPGQMIWKAINASEPAGKPLSKCVFHRIILTVHQFNEDRPVKQLAGMSAKRQQQILRITIEAEDQNTLLTIEDLGLLLDCNEKTIRRDIKLLEATYDIKVPTRGNKCDIGPGITHREKIVELFIQGQDPLTISRTMKHSLKAVERYIQSFCRIIYSQQQLKNSLKTALVTGFSMQLVSRCLALRDRYMLKDDYRERVEEIKEIGTKYWKSIDSKKKLGLMERKQK
jgi:hypothetical protein